MTRRDLLWSSPPLLSPQKGPRRIPWLSVAIGASFALPVMIVASVLFTSNGAINISWFGAPWLEIRLPRAAGGGNFVNMDAWIGLPLLALLLIRVLVRPRARAALRRLMRELAR